MPVSISCGLLELSPWHLKQISYSLALCSRKVLPEDWPRTPISAPLTWVATPGRLFALCGLWQSTHSTCRGAPGLVSGMVYIAEFGASDSSCAEGVISTGLR